MAENLQGQAAVVTGGTRGIGRAIAEALLRAGVSVAICGRNEHRVAEAVDEMKSLGRVVGKACHVGRFEQVERFFNFVEGELDRLDILVNNAGIGAFGPVDEIDPRKWQDVIDTNLSGVFYCCREAAPRMKKMGRGFIINIGSLAGKNPFAGGAAYNASKFGLAGFTEAMMLDLRQDNIRVSTIMPGSVQTDFSGSGTAGGDWKIDPAHIADTILHLLQMPHRSLASRVEMRPSRPPKKR